jgi:hypothetical protein
MKVHHYEDLCVTDQEIDTFKMWNSSQMSHQIQDQEREESPNPRMNLWAIQEKERM